MPCHNAVNYTRKDWREAQEESVQCAGRAAMWANQAKRPRDPNLIIGTKDPTVFSHIREFNEHHDIRRTL